MLNMNQSHTVTQKKGLVALKGIANNNNLEQVQPHQSRITEVKVNGLLIPQICLQRDFS